MALTKDIEVSDVNSCLNRAADDEPVFTLRAHNPAAPYAVLDWITRSFDVQDDATLREAFEVALAMKNYSGRKWIDKLEIENLGGK